jgi:plastocyanin
MIFLRSRLEKTLRVALLVCLLVFQSAGVAAAEPVDHSNHGSHRMAVMPAGAVMNENRDNLPRDCTGISRDYAFTIRASRAYARDVPGMIYGMSQHEVQVQGCSRIEINFVNEDEVRHQWMVHGLPKYLYPAGMFHIEAAGGQTMTGTFIVPGDDQTYLIHCDMAQHMEKGMRGQLVVGKGSGDLWGIPGVSDEFYRSGYLPPYAPLLGALAFTLALIGTLWLSTDPGRPRER